jgi:chemotaxis protein methyltransferase CheR
MTGLFSKASSLNTFPPITEAEFVQLRDFIYQQTGIYIPDNRHYLLENRLVNRLKEHGLTSFQDYCYFLKYDSSRRQELERLFAVITTNETSFFRNPPQLKIFQDTVLPELLKAKRRAGSKKLRIWSAGCSTGEEPYTLAIILKEVLGSEIAAWDLRILGNDLSTDVLDRARTGVYTRYTLRSTPEDIVKRYFTSHDNGTFGILPEIKNMVSFSRINLSDRFQIKTIESSDIVFCRNVIIYFDESVKKLVINGIYDNLLPGGHLFVGHSESLHNITRAFRPRHYPGGIVYTKEGS